MDPELKRLLEQNLALSKENNRMLSAMRRNAWLGFIWKIIIWAVFLILPLYFYQQYLAPILAKFSPSNSATSTSSGFFGFPSSAEIQKLLDFYKTK